MRLDSLLSAMGADTKSELKKNIRKAGALVDGELIKDPGRQVDEGCVVIYNNREFRYAKYQYYMMNKPAGVVSATKDNRDTTVVDLMKNQARKDIFPVGRLDKDSVGLLILTNDGDLAHSMLTPSKHVPKTYYVEVDDVITGDDVKAFEEGIVIDDEFTALPAKLYICDDKMSARCTVYEGKFHQVKRMFKARGKNVLFLKREKMGELCLDENLAPGEYRLLNEEEIKLLKDN